MTDHTCNSSDEVDGIWYVIPVVICCIVVHLFALCMLDNFKEKSFDDVFKKNDATEETSHNDADCSQMEEKIYDKINRIDDDSIKDVIKDLNKKETLMREKGNSDLFNILLSVYKSPCALSSACFVSAFYLALMVFVFLRLLLCEDGVDGGVKGRDAFVIIFIVIQFLLMLRTTVDTFHVYTKFRTFLKFNPTPLREPSAVIILFFILQAGQIIVSTLFVILSVHRAENEYNMIVTIGALRALQDADLIVFDALQIFILGSWAFLSSFCCQETPIEKDGVAASLKE